jgi:hypothetical protein
VLDCEPAGWIASLVARNVSPAAWSVADNLSRKRTWIASRGRYDCKPLQLPFGELALAIAAAGCFLTATRALLVALLSSVCRVWLERYPELY